MDGRSRRDHRARPLVPLLEDQKGTWRSAGTGSARRISLDGGGGFLRKNRGRNRVQQRQVGLPPLQDRVPRASLTCSQDRGRPVDSEEQSPWPTRAATFWGLVAFEVVRSSTWEK
jgi:hypothetical protein